MLTKSFLLWFGWTGFTIVPICEVLWFYKSIDTSAIRRGKVQPRFHLVCAMTNGRVYGLELFAECDVDYLLSVMTWRRPEVMFGCHEEWIELAERGVAGVKHEVACRKAEWEHLSWDGRDEWRDVVKEDALDSPEWVAEPSKKETGV
jgi:hypothetical protein